MVWIGGLGFEPLVPVEGKWVSQQSAKGYVLVSVHKHAKKGTSSKKDDVSTQIWSEQPPDFMGPSHVYSNCMSDQDWAGNELQRSFPWTMG